MPRFDFDRRRGRPGYLLGVQAGHLYLLPSRVVKPPLPPPALPAIRDLTPLLTVEGETLAMMTHFPAAVPKRELGKPVGNPLAEHDAIVAPSTCC